MKKFCLVLCLLLCAFSVFASERITQPTEGNLRYAEEGTPLTGNDWLLIGLSIFLIVLVVLLIIFMISYNLKHGGSIFDYKGPYMLEH